MENFPLLTPWLVAIPALGAFINFFWGKAMGERLAGYIAVTASVLTFILSVLIFQAVGANHGISTVVDPFAIFGGWFNVQAGTEFNLVIPWQFRVDSLTATMLLVVTGVGSLIHIYSVGYIHGDPKAERFFAYLNVFLGFMLILVTGNNFLMMFVGWEGVGLSSFLLIGFWWDRQRDGWSNANAARKAMILNRIGDFGILMAIFLIFWTFGTIDYYRPSEIANTTYQLQSFGYLEDEGHGDDEDHSASFGFGIAVAQAQEEETSEAAAGAEPEEEGVADDHGGHTPTEAELDNSRFMPEQLGVFGQAQMLADLEDGEEIVWGVDADGNEYTRGRDVSIGTWTMDIQTSVTLIVIFLLIGAAGKSAQIPLFVWLPDAMAGPTPVSALMHAATMVTAGIYLLVRSSVLLEIAPLATFLIAVVGALTALAGGFMAIGQWDIKRVLAYSTVSQLGFMIAAVGIGAYVAAMFHLVTHALFKALLFLGSGSVIHGVEHGEHHVHEHGHGHDEHGHDEHHADHADDHAFDPQDMRNMGGLRSRMPITFYTYMIGTFALMGLPFFAGFWSKDEILAHAWDKIFSSNALDVFTGMFVFGVLLVAAGFTAFYMWRQVQLVFFGKPRSEAAEHAPESVWWMTGPLIVLAIASIFGGFINVPAGIWPFSAFYSDHHAFGHFIEPVIPYITEHPALDFNWLVAILATAVGFGAIYLAHTRYYAAEESTLLDALAEGEDPMQRDPLTKQVWSFSNARMYWDDVYHAVFLRPYERIGKFFADTLDWNFLHDYFHDKIIKRGYDVVSNILSKPIDIGIIDGIVNGVGRLTNAIGQRTRGVQTGYVRTYALALLFGVVAVVVLMLAPLLFNGS